MRRLYRSERRRTGEIIVRDGYMRRLGGRRDGDVRTADWRRRRRRRGRS